MKIKIILIFGFYLFSIVFFTPTSFAGGYLSSPLKEYTVNSWFDHSTPKYTYDKYIGQMTLWNGKVSTTSVDIDNCGLGINCYDGHDGIDLRALYVPVYAAADGIITEATSSSRVGIGNFMRIWHATSTSIATSSSSYYGHLNAFVMKGGDRVAKGQLIAYSGDTGNVKPHLHFGTYESSLGGHAVDPYGFTGTTTSGYDTDINGKKYYWTGTTTDAWAPYNKGYLWATYPPTFGGYNVVDVKNNIASSTTWTNGNVYVVHGLIQVKSKVTLKIEPGVIVKFYDTASGLDISGSLILNHNSVSPGGGPPTTDKVYFTSYKDDSVGGDTNGDLASTTPQFWNWGYLLFEKGSHGDIYNAVIRYGGYDITYPYYNSGVNILGDYIDITYTDIYLNSIIGIQQLGGVLNLSYSNINNNQGVGSFSYGLFIINGTSTISNNNFGSAVYSNQAHGIYLIGGTSTVSDNIFTSHKYYGIFASGSASSSKITFVKNKFYDNTIGATVMANDVDFNNSGNISEGKGINAIILSGSRNRPIRLTKNDLNYVTSDYTIQSKGSLTIDPGVVLKLQLGTGLSSYGVVQINGTPSNKIYLTSIKDDSIGGDTNGDGTSTKPNLGDWRSLGLNPHSTTTINNVVINYGGGAGPSAAVISFFGDNILFKNSTINYSQYSAFNQYAGFSEINNVNFFGTSSAIVIHDGTSTIKNSIIGSSTAPIIKSFLVYTSGVYQTGGYLDLINNDISNFNLNGFHAFSSSAYTKRCFISKNRFNNIKGSGSSAVLIEGPNCEIANNQFTDNDYAITLKSDYLDSTVHYGNTATGTGMNSLLINGPLYFYDRTIPVSSDLGYVMKSFTINSGRTLNIDPGVVLKFPSGGTINNSGTLNINGSTSLPVYLTSVSDDSIGTDVSSSTNPQAGDWYSIVTNSKATTTVKNSFLKYGGAYNNGYFGSMYNNSGVSTLDNARISNSLDRGIYHNTGTTTITNSVINQKTGSYGFYSVSGGLKLINIASSSMYGSSTYGFYQSGTPTTTAINNWWGDASGPYNAKYNPAGKGNPISDYVDFIPWLTSDPNP